MMGNNAVLVRNNRGQEVKRIAQQSRSDYPCKVELMGVYHGKKAPREIRKYNKGDFVGPDTT